MILDQFETLTLARVLTADETKTLRTRLEQRGGTDVLAAPRVTTVDGRQAQLSIMETRTIVTELHSQPDPATNASPIRARKGAAQMQHVTEEIPVGIRLDMIPRWQPEGGIIQISVTNVLTEFLRYDDPNTRQAKGGAATGSAVVGVTPLPHFRLRQVGTQADIPAGGTLVLGGPIVYDRVLMKDKIAVLGDIPLLGRLFRREQTGELKKHLIILITPKRIHSTGTTTGVP